MKILQITNKVPYPPLEGGSIAMNIITQGLLKAGHQVKVLSMNTSKYSVEIDLLPADYKKSTRIEAVLIDNKVKPADAILNLLFSKKSYHIVRFISRDFEKKIIEILHSEKFDIIQLEMLYVTPHIDVIRKFSDAKIILRAQNIENFIWDRTASNCKNILKKYYLNVLVKRLKKFELEYLQKVDGIAAISSQDMLYLERLGINIPMVAIPVAVDIHEDINHSVKMEFPSLFHLGSMNWMPNIDGIRWFLNNVWTQVNTKYPQLKFYLAGRNMPKWLYDVKLPNIEIIGEVPNSDDFMLSKSIMIVPLFAGSGMRVKIIEGMRLGKTIISTIIGAEGIDCEHGKNILIANNPRDFVCMIDKCISDETYCKMIGDNARTLILEKYNNTTITQKLTTFYKQIIAQHNAI